MLYKDYLSDGVKIFFFPQNQDCSLPMKVAINQVEGVGDTHTLSEIDVVFGDGHRVVCTPVGSKLVRVGQGWVQYTCT